MPLDESDLKYIWDIVEEARNVIDFTTGQTLESFLSDRLHQRATERSIEIIGEAARMSPRERASNCRMWRGAPSSPLATFSRTNTARLSTTRSGALQPSMCRHSSNN